MKITNQSNVAVGRFYWLNYLEKERIGQAINFYGEIRFVITGFDDAVEFDSVSEIYPVCLMKH